MNNSKNFGTSVAAGLLSLFIPGAGHCYIGQRRRFLLPFAVGAAIILSLGAAGLLSTLWGFTGMMAIELAVFLFGIVDSSIIGFRHGAGESKLRNRLVATLLWTLAVVALIFVWAAFREPLLGYAVYRIPSPTMKPTLEVGDTILVNTRRSIDATLASGAIVVVRNDASKRLYVRRLQEKLGANSYALSHDWTWAPRSADPETVRQEDIVGMVTAVLWSPQRQRFGFVP